MKKRQTKKGKCLATVELKKSKKLSQGWRSIMIDTSKCKEKRSSNELLQELRYGTKIS